MEKAQDLISLITVLVNLTIGIINLTIVILTNREKKKKNPQSTDKK